MNSTDKFLQTLDLQNTDDIDSLIKLADRMRQLINDEQYPDINAIINHTIKNSCYEAFSWCMSILQEELEKQDSAARAFECTIGQAIPDYDEFAQRLQLDFNVSANGVEKVYDKNGEIESFFNTLVYQTGYKNILLVSAENFDVKDNDYAQYKLVFGKN